MTQITTGSTVKLTGYTFTTSGGDQTPVPGDLLRAKERVEHDKGSRRYRPTDVAGAALLSRDKRPAGAEDVEPLAQKFECVLHALAATS